MTSWSDLFIGACALMLVFEGILPFLNPALWRRIFERATRMGDGQLRFIGLSSMVAGSLLLWLFWR